VAALERVKANLKRYRAAVLKAAVDGSLSTSSAKSGYFDHIRWRPLSDIVVSLEQGWSPKCEREGSDNPEEWVVMKTTAVQPLRYLEVENKLLPSALSPRQELELKAGDLLITRAGPRSRAGVTCLVRHTRPRVILCDKAYRMRLDKSLVEPGFVEIVLNSPPMLDMLDELKTGISDSGVNLTQKRFLELKLPVPPLTIQRAIEQDILRQLSVIEAAENECVRSVMRASRLRQSILKQAFEGNLVPQDPKDEPAGRLLERIKVQSAEAASNGKPATSKRKRPKQEAK
jgi:type I restriction enzyme S subunit